MVPEKVLKVVWERIMTFVKFSKIMFQTFLHLHTKLEIVNYDLWVGAKLQAKIKKAFMVIESCKTI